MNTNIVTHRFDRLKAIRWGSASEWKSIARDHIYKYYERVLQVWPEDQVKLFPHDSILTNSFSNRLAASEIEQVNLMLQAIVEKAENSKFVLTPMNCVLIKLILTCSILRDIAELADREDPSEALLQLYDDGFDLSANHDFLDICYQTGCTSMPLPDRTTIARRVNY